MKKILCWICVFLISGVAIGRTDEKTPAAEVFPAEPPAAIAGNTIQDGLGRSVRLMVWSEGDKLFWYFEPVAGSIADFVIYPGDIIVTQGDKLFQHVEFLDKNRQPFAGPIKEPLLVRFSACGWEQSGMQCVDYKKRFEVFVPPTVTITIEQGIALKVNTMGVK